MVSCEDVLMASLIITHMVFMHAVSAVYYSNFLDPAVIVVLPVPDDSDPESSPNESPAGEDPNLPDIDREMYHGDDGDGDSEEPMSEDEACTSGSSSASGCSHWSYSRLGTNRHASVARCRLCGLIWRGGPATFPPWPL
jgi:hypothetical protein